MTPRLLCKVMGVVFIAVAVWGFVTGDHVLMFHVNPAHNAVHLLSGLGALACGFSGPYASRLFCIIFGCVYGLVALLGFAGVARVVELLHLNAADNWLHAAIAVLFLGVALIPKISVPTASPRAA